MSGLAADAAKGALSMAQVSPDDVDIVLMCTSTPENLFGDAARVRLRKHLPLLYKYLY